MIERNSKVEKKKMQLIRDIEIYPPHTNANIVIFDFKCTVWDVKILDILPDVINVGTCLNLQTSSGIHYRTQLGSSFSGLLSIHTHNIEDFDYKKHENYIREILREKIIEHVEKSYKDYSHKKFMHNLSQSIGILTTILGVIALCKIITKK